MAQQHHEDDVADLQTPDAILLAGLKLQHVTDKRLAKNKRSTQVEWFQSSYGCPPIVVAQIWSDLQTTTVDAARIGDDGVKIKITDFLHTLEFLKCYATEKKREGPSEKNAKTMRKYVWYYAEKLQALKEEKIVFPVDYPDDTVWIMTVDGVHCAINEPRAQEYSQDEKHFSHKKNRAGWCYELGISLLGNALIWMNGPFKAGNNDKTILVAGGLKEHLATLGLKAIGDKFYNGHTAEISTFNALDSKPVKKFKSRALLRQEGFNGLLKQFAVLDGRFRHHGIDKFATCFEAVAVICQYRIELECPLFPV